MLSQSTSKTVSTKLGYSVILYDAPSPQDGSAELDNWSRRWDGALIEIKLPAGFKLDPMTISDLPPKIGHNIYNIGAPLQTPLKVSPDGSVIRHIVDFNDPNPRLRTIRPYGSFSTTLDQFPSEYSKASPTSKLDLWAQMLIVNR